MAVILKQVLSLARNFVKIGHKIFTIIFIVKVSAPVSHAGVKEERKYSFYSFLTSALDGGEW
jgi:hypothetical protein